MQKFFEKFFELFPWLNFVMWMDVTYHWVLNKLTPKDKEKKNGDR